MKISLFTIAAALAASACLSATSVSASHELNSAAVFSASAGKTNLIRRNLDDGSQWSEQKAPVQPLESRDEQQEREQREHEATRKEQQERERKE